MEKVDLLTGSVAQLQDNYIKLESDVEDKTAKLWEECRRLSREHSVSTSTAVGTLKTEVTERTILSFCLRARLSLHVRQRVTATHWQHEQTQA